MERVKTEQSGGEVDRVGMQTLDCRIDWRTAVKIMSTCIEEGATRSGYSQEKEGIKGQLL